VRKRITKNLELVRIEEEPAAGGKLKLEDRVVSYVGGADGESRRNQMVEILSEAVYAHLTLKGLVRKESPLSGKEN